MCLWDHVEIQKGVYTAVAMPSLIPLVSPVHTLTGNSTATLFSVDISLDQDIEMYIASTVLHACPLLSSDTLGYAGHPASCQSFSRGTCTSVHWTSCAILAIVMISRPFPAAHKISMNVTRHQRGPRVIAFSEMTLYKDRVTKTQQRRKR